MARLVKCPRCNKMNNKEDTTEISKRYYCDTCADELLDEREARKTDWDILFQYICDLYEIPKPTILMFKQIKDFKSDYGMTDIGIYYTIKYYHEILGNPVLEGSGLGIVVYYYDKAKQHVMKTYEIADKVEEFVTNEKVVNVEVNPISVWKPKKPLDLSVIDWGEDYED